MEIATQPAETMQSVDNKFEELKNILSEYIPDGLIVAFSGGIDSAFLLWAAVEAAQNVDGKVLALTTKSHSVPLRDLEDAREFARSVGADHEIIESHEFEKEGYLENLGLRCYHCKSTLFEIATEMVQELGYGYIAYGYNASDTGDVRPGHKAALENGVLYPLAKVGLTKNDIRTLMADNGFNIAEKPASPCLSSRIMTGVRVTPEKLQNIEELENILWDHGMRIFRVRLHEDNDIQYIRLEMSPEEMPKIFEIREQFVQAAQEKGFRWVNLDLEGYKMGGAVT